MRVLTTLLVSAASLCLLACHDSSTAGNHAEEAETKISSAASKLLPMPKDVLYTSRSLISGSLYARPSFDGTVLARFDTSQQLYVVDTTDNIFVKAHLLQDTSLQTGYVPKAILPERLP